MRKQYRGYLFTFFSLVALLMVLPGTSVVSAKAQTPLASHQKAASLTCRGLSIVASPNVGSSNNLLLGVAAISASDVWAVGEYLNNSIGNTQTLIEHWNGWRWSVVASSNVGSDPNVLYSVAVVSASDVWAVGNYLNSSTSADQTLIEHWNGWRWNVVASPYVGTLYSVAAISARNIWAVGDNGSTQTLIEHWNGWNWSIIASPNVGSRSNALNSVAAVSASDIWAVGDYSNSVGNTQALLEHWNGTSWSVVVGPNVGSGSNELYSVAAVSTDNIWAVGYFINGIVETLIEHWNGTNWSVVASPNVGSSGNSLHGVAAVSASNIWAVGTNFQTLIEHWDGTSWSFVGSLNIGSGSNALIGMAAVPGSSNVWAVGDYYYGSNGTDRTLIELYC